MDERMLGDETLARELSDLKAVMVRVDTKLDLMVSTTADHEQRIRKLEAKVYMATGAGSILGTIGGIVAGVLVK